MITRPGMSWKQDGIHTRIYDHGELVMSIYLGEAIEAAGRTVVEEHIKVIESCGYIPGWENSNV